MLCHNIKDYIKECNICLALKAVQHKTYGNLPSLLVFIQHWKDLLLDFIIGLPILIDWKDNCYDSILIIVNRITKTICYKPVKVTINTLGLVDIIMDILERNYGLSKSIVTN